MFGWLKRIADSIRPGIGQSVFMTATGGPILLFAYAAEPAANVPFWWWWVWGISLVAGLGLFFGGLIGVGAWAVRRFRLLPPLLRRVKVILVPVGEDPDSYDPKYRQFMQEALTQKTKLGNDLRLEADQAAQRAQTAERLAGRLHKAVNVAVTWLYRRQNWNGLSEPGRSSQPAPWDIWAKAKYEHLGLRGIAYDPPEVVAGEPEFEPTSNVEASMSPAAFGRQVELSAAGDAARNAIKVAIANLIHDANNAHDKLTTGGSDEELDRVANEWYSDAQAVLTEHVPDHLSSFQADRSYTRQLRRGMTPRQTFLLQWLEDRTERLGAILKATR